MSAIYSYHASESGAVLMRDGVAVADIVDGKVKMREEHKKHAIQAGKFWKSHNAPAQKPSIEPVSLAEIMQDLPGVPPMPPMDPQLGTKTEAVVEWYKRYQPEVWAKMHKNWSGR